MSCPRLQVVVGPSVSPAPYSPPHLSGHMSTRAECEVTADTASYCSVTFGELLGEMTMTNT